MMKLFTFLAMATIAATPAAAAPPASVDDPLTLEECSANANSDLDAYIECYNTAAAAAKSEMESNRDLILNAPYAPENFAEDFIADQKYWEDYQSKACLLYKEEKGIMEAMCKYEVVEFRRARLENLVNYISFRKDIIETPAEDEAPSEDL